MRKRPLKNAAASVHQRLLNKAYETGRPFNDLLQYYAMERFLYRLSKSHHSNKFVLKGALMFLAWRTPMTRPTKDIDLLGRLSNNIDGVVEIIRKICAGTGHDDGLVFDTAGARGERITEDAKYEGIRVRLAGCMGTARITLQIDIGFGDVVSPQARKIELPTILDDPVPVLFGYSRDSIIAEKFEAMVKHDLLNSRMKDFYDIWLLSRQFDFNGKTLSTAIKKTFENRGTKVSAYPTAFDQSFFGDPVKIVQWKAFIRKSQLENAPADFSDAVQGISDFLAPVIDAISRNHPLNKVWKKASQWE